MEVPFIEHYAGQARMTDAIREVHGDSTLRLDYDYHRSMNILKSNGFLNLGFRMLQDNLHHQFSSA